MASNQTSQAIFLNVATKSVFIFFFSIFPAKKFSSWVSCLHISLSLCLSLSLSVCLSLSLIPFLCISRFHSPRSVAFLFAFFHSFIFLSLSPSLSFRFSVFSFSFFSFHHFPSNFLSSFHLSLSIYLFLPLYPHLPCGNVTFGIAFPIGKTVGGISVLWVEVPNLTFHSLICLWCLFHSCLQKVLHETKGRKGQTSHLESVCLHTTNVQSFSVKCTAMSCCLNFKGLRDILIQLYPSSCCT